jgi:hypothetical protein
MNGMYGDLLRGHIRGEQTRRPKDLEDDASVTAFRGLWFIRALPVGRPNLRSTTRADILPFLLNKRTVCQPVLKSTRERHTLLYFLISRTAE